MTSRLLVADDSITIQKIVDMAFEIEDVEVEGIGNGEEAFERISEFNPDIVLADVDMPGLNGFELSSKIKESPQTSSIKVLLLASDFEDFDEQRYQACRADNHISKPFKSDDIVAMVKSMLDAPLSNDENIISLSSNDLVEEEDSAELTDTEIIDQLLEAEEVGATPATDTPEREEELSNEEPSLEELLASVEQLSTDGLAVIDEDFAGALEQPVIENEDAPPAELPEPAELVAEELPVELSEPEELVAEELPVELPEPAELMAEELPVELPEIAELTAEVSSTEFSDPKDALETSSDEDIMDQMIRGVEELKESVQFSDVPTPEDADIFDEGEEGDSDSLSEVAETSQFTEDSELFTEVRSGNLDNMDDLDSTFKEIVLGGRGGLAPNSQVEHPAELSTMGGIVPEPEDLLESIAPGTFSELGKRPATPEDIKENLDYLSRLSDQDQDMSRAHDNLRQKDWNYEGDPFSQAVADEVKRLLQRSLSSSLEREVAGLSEVILSTIREVVREVTPEIARKVILEEIEKIKK
ncbi:MAG: response regulator [Nitrospinaceae bacterium]|nr:response regulator [Nitrospinaceae bacterium]